MKLNSFLSTALIATVAALSFGAQAADADKAPAEQTEKTTPKKVKPHSHMTEKTGIPAAAPEATGEKAAPAKDAKRAVVVPIPRLRAVCSAGRSHRCP